MEKGPETCLFKTKCHGTLRRISITKASLYRHNTQRPKEPNGTYGTFEGRLARGPQEWHEQT